MPAMFKDLAQLFENPRRAKLLKFFLFQPDMRTDAQAAGAAVGISKAAAEKEARALARAGILFMRKQKKGTQFSLNHAHPWLAPLAAFLEATTLPDDRAVLRAFKGISGISLLAATGALANEERASVDLLVVARKSKSPAVAKAVYKLECALGLPLRYAFLEPAAYTSRLEANDRLLRDVIEYKHRLISGHF